MSGLNTVTFQSCETYTTCKQYFQLWKPNTKFSCNNNHFLVNLWHCHWKCSRVYVCAKEHPEKYAHDSRFDVFPTAWQWSMSLLSFIDIGTSTREATIWKNILSFYTKFISWSLVGLKLDSLCLCMCFSLELRFISVFKWFTSVWYSVL